MRLPAILGLCVLFGAVAYAGDGGDGRICETCEQVDDVYTVVVDGYYTYTGNYGLAYRGPSAPSPAEPTAWGSIKALFR